EGLAIARSIHDRYHPSRRNPWNEIECGDHYSRSMASYGVFLAACGYEYHGPKRSLGFAPRLSPENFRAAFTTSEGWGTFAQKDGDGAFRASVHLKWGKLALKSLSLVPAAKALKTVSATLAGNPIGAALSVSDGRAQISFTDEIEVSADQELVV